MKLTIKKLKQIIKEELSLVLEYHDDEQFPSPEERRKAYLKNLAFLQKQGLKEVHNGGNWDTVAFLIQKFKNN